MKGSEDKWWIKEPRSRRICLNCGHKHASHVPLCIKVISLGPKKECTCRDFIGTEHELKMFKKKMLNKNKKENQVDAL